VELLDQVGIALLSSLIGAALGFLGGLTLAERQATRAQADAPAIYRQERADRAAALLRALDHELELDEATLRDAEHGKRWGETIDTAWRACLELDLTPRRLQALGSAYLRMRQYNAALRAREAGGYADRVLEEWAHTAGNEVRFARSILKEQ
jgi:hypothetical protein